MFHVKEFLEAVKISSLGYLGIFIVMLIVFLSVKLLCTLLRERKEKAE